jgi:hypothetical protein
MPSTPSAYPQVISRTFALFGVVEFRAFQQVGAIFVASSIPGISTE